MVVPPQLKVFASDSTGVTIRIEPGFLPELLESLIEVDCDYGSRPPKPLRRLGATLVEAVAADHELRVSATGALGAELAGLLAFSKQRWPLES